MVRQICTVAFLSTLSFAQDYYVTYKFYSEDFTIYNENVFISKAMVDTEKTPIRSFSFPTDYNSKEKLIGFEKDKIISLLLKQYANTSSKTTVKGGIATIKTSLRIYPKKIKVEINNGLAKIGLYD